MNFKKQAKIIMKIRIKENSLRIRLLKSEVNKLVTGINLQEQTCFTSNILTYALKIKEDDGELSADFEDNIITMYVPKKLLTNWDTNAVVGFNTNMKINETTNLFLLLEKDFVCTDTTTEDQSDNFTDPAKKC